MWLRALLLVLLLIGCTTPTPPSLPRSEPASCKLPPLSLERLEPGEQREFSFSCGPKGALSDGPEDWEEQLRAEGYEVEGFGYLIDTNCGSIFQLRFSKGQVCGELYASPVSKGKCTRGRQYWGRLQKGSPEGTFEPWRIRPDEPAACGVPKKHPVVAFVSPDGTRVVTTSDELATKVWDAVTGALLFSLAGESGLVTKVGFSPDGALLLTEGYGNDVKIWDAQSGTLLSTLGKHKGGVRDFTFTRDSAHVLTVAGDNTPQMWVARTGELLFRVEERTTITRGSALSPDSERIITVVAYDAVKIRDARTGRLLFSLGGGKKTFSTAKYSPDGSRILTTLDGTAEVWDASSGSLLYSLQGLAPNLMWDAGFSPDGTLLFTTNKRKTVKLWDATTGQPISRLEGLSGTSFYTEISADNTRVLTRSSKQSVEVWDVKAGALLFFLKASTSNWSVYLSADFSPDGAYILSCVGSRLRAVLTLV